MRISDWSSDVCSSDLRVLRVEDVRAVQQDRAGCDLLRIQRVYTVEHAQQGGLAAARGLDQRGDLLLRYLEGDALERVEPVVVEIEPAGRQLGRRGGFDGPAGRRDAGKGDVVHGLGPRGNEGGCGDAGEGQLSHGSPACAKRSRAPPG